MTGQEMSARPTAEAQLSGDRQASQALVHGGVHQVTAVPITTDRDGSLINVTVHTLTGSRPGPRLALFGAQHGDEWFTIKVLHALFTELRTWDFAGSVIIVPVCSPTALGDGCRVTQVSSDEPDLNRAWSSRHTWLTSQIATTLSEQVVAGCDVLVDLHLGPWASAFGAVAYGQDFTDKELVRRSREMAYAFGYPAVLAMNVATGFPGPGSLAGHAAEARGIPSVLVEIGGGGFGPELEAGWSAEVVNGIRNVMIHLEMLAGPAPALEGQFSPTRTARVNPRFGGLLLPENEFDTLMRPVAEGEVLGRVVCPQTFVELEVLRAPCQGRLFYMARSYLVGPGEWAFGIFSDE